MLIPSVIPSAIHLADSNVPIKGTRGSEIDDINSMKSYPALQKMVDATTMQQDETQSTHQDNSPLTTGINDYSFKKKRNNSIAFNNQSSQGDGITILLHNMNESTNYESQKRINTTVNGPMILNIKASGKSLMRSSVHTNSSQQTGTTTMKINKKKRVMSSLHYINKRSHIDPSQQIRESTESMGGVINVEDEMDTEPKD
jgi:hypothetical protein